MTQTPVDTALRVCAADLVQAVEAAITDPSEHVPSRIRHAAYELRNVLAYIERQGPDGTRNLSQRTGP